MSVAVMTDTNSGMTVETGKKVGAAVIPMPVILDGTIYYEGINLTREDFFRSLEQGKQISTSQPAPGDVLEMWNRLLEEYDEVVYIPMSSGLSGSCQTARMLAEDYQGRVQVVDNHRISIPQKNSVMDALYLAEKGCSAREIKRELERTAFDCMIYIGVDTLKYLKRGGRITAAAAAMGSVLNIKLLLKIEGEKLDAHAKIRGTNACKRRLMESMRQSVEQFHSNYAKISVDAASTYLSDADQQGWYALAKENFPDEAVSYDSLALSIACHVGPGAFGMAVTRRIAGKEFGHERKQT